MTASSLDSINIHAVIMNKNTIKHHRMEQTGTPEYWQQRWG
ncbi:Hypothetical protein ETEE_1702 [Edwardsiella anguillarum ET080813]|uniref:Uncharacterized protein n=1 Tax=Edwardsiella anguillarum ET080813 TaxID=667120 RepID=A0A076LJL6_9GAMM|nr:Hypothetical protein ETEE_1702 [Edwardsiella anguillarum ET080813]